MGGAGLFYKRGRSFCLAVLSNVLLLSPGSLSAQGPKTAPQSSPQASSSSPALKVINTIPNFLSFWTEAESKPEANQIELFRQRVIQAHPELFAENVVNMGQKLGPSEENRQIATYLQEVRPLIPAIRILNGRLQNDLQAYVRDFTAVFPDYHPSTPVYFTVSLGHFDGGTRDVDGHTALLFGVDLIAGEYGPNAKLSVLFDHELFHQYHQSLGIQSADSDSQLWQSLWEEGLAQYVSWRMNPSADENDVLLSKTLAARAGPLLPSLARGLLHDLQSTAPKDYARYFLGGTTDTGIPARSGYFLGFLVACRIGQSSTPFALAHLSGVSVREQLEQALKDFTVTAAARQLN